MTLSRQNKLYHKVHSDENLTEAWHHVRRGSEAAGVDGITLAHFQRRLFSGMKELQQELSERRLVPQSIKRFSIPKSGGNQRPVGILTVRDRIVQRAVLQVIEPLFEADFEDCSFGYRRERSAQMAVERLQQLTKRGLVWVVHVDIQSFFDRINVSRLEALAFKKITNRELRRLIRGWLTEQTLTVERGGLFRRPRRRGILQGGILSPLFANIYLHQFDRMALLHGLKLIRYADDILILCRTKRAARKTYRAAQQFLRELDLELHPVKTEIVNVTEGMRFLGQRILLEQWSEKENSTISFAEDGDELQEDENLEIADDNTLRT